MKEEADTAADCAECEEQEARDQNHKDFTQQGGDVALDRVAFKECRGDEDDACENQCECHYGQKNSNHVIGMENVNCSEEEEEEQERKAALALEDVEEITRIRRY